MFFKQKLKNEDGITMPLVLVFSGIFVIMLSGLTGFILLQKKVSSRRESNVQALFIAEAGLNYYRWHLAHDSSDYQDGTGGAGPYVHAYTDPQGGTLGYFSLEITAPQPCSTVTTITSTGWTADQPSVTRTIQAKYGKPSLAEYSFLTNSNIWFGDTEGVSGKMHSNGGIRMDGTQDSLFTSAKETYTCGPEHGCAGGGEIKDGIWGSGIGGAAGLWQFPVPAIDYDGITADLASMKTLAQTSGHYLGPSGANGYYLKFKSNGTIDVHRVTNLRNAVWGHNGTDWVFESNDFTAAPKISTITLSSGAVCDEGNLIFVEDKVWVDGEATEKATIVAAVFPDLSSTNASIVINDNLENLGSGSNQKIALIAQKDILVPLYSPDDLQIDAVLLAQKGHCMRYYYSNSYSPWHIRNSITVNGSVITNTIWTWSWVDGGGTTISGYRNTASNYDSDLIYNPPPYFPTYGQDTFISWEEIE